jgi:hypothetical protein
MKNIRTIAHKLELRFQGIEIPDLRNGFGKRFAVTAGTGD